MAARLSPEKEKCTAGRRHHRPAVAPTRMVHARSAGVKALRCEPQRGNTPNSNLDLELPRTPSQFHFSSTEGQSNKFLTRVWVLYGRGSCGHSPPVSRGYPACFTRRVETQSYLSTALPGSRQRPCRNSIVRHVPWICRGSRRRPPASAESRFSPSYNARISISSSRRVNVRSLVSDGIRYITRSTPSRSYCSSARFSESISSHRKRWTVIRIVLGSRPRSTARSRNWTHSPRKSSIGIRLGSHPSQYSTTRSSERDAIAPSRTGG